MRRVPFALLCLLVVLTTLLGCELGSSEEAISEQELGLTAGGFTTTASAPSSATVSSSVAIRAFVTSNARTTATVRITVVNASQVEMWRAEFANQSFRTNRQRSFDTTWNVPTTAASGAYRVVVAIYSASSTRLHSNDQAAIVTVAAPTSPPPSTTLSSPIYRDALSSGWENWSWSAGVNLAVTQPVYAGTHALGFTAQSGWAGLYLHHSGVNGAQFTSLKFAARASATGQRLSVALYGTDGQQLAAELPLANVGGDPPVGSWRLYEIPLTTLGAASATVTGIVFQDTTGVAQPALYLDELGFASIAQPPPPPTSNRRVVAYFPTWIRNTGYTELDIDFSIVTHVAHFSVDPRADGTVAIQDWGPFPDPALVSRTHAMGAKIVLTVGGAHASSTSGFAAMTSSASTRQAFVTNLMNLVNTHGYDGVDLDWEYPQSATERTNFTALIAALRSALGSARSLSIAVAADSWTGQWIDIPAVVPNLTWVGVMTYDFHAPSWSGHSGHNAPLYTNPADNFHSGTNYSVSGSRAYYGSRGVPNEKLLIGLPFYGYRFDGANELHQSLSHTGGAQVSYPDVVPLINNGWTRYWDATARGPYLLRTGGGGVLPYDDASSIQEKCRYVTSEGIGGAIIWHVGFDKIGSSQPLLGAAAACR